MIHKVGCPLVTTGGGGELAGKDRRPTRSTKDPSCVSVAEVNSTLGKLVNVWGNGPWGLAKTADPIVHVIYGKEEDIGFFFGKSQKG